MKIYSNSIYENGNKQFGDIGENVAYGFLKQNGYQILATKYKNIIGEIDIIARDLNSKERFICFIEVKSRKSFKFGEPREAVTFSKQKQIKRVAMAYIAKYQIYDAPMRFDVIEYDEEKINHIKNAFY